MRLLPAIFVVFNLLSWEVRAGFVLQDGFSDFLHNQFSNLTQHKNRVNSTQKSLALKSAMTALFGFIAPYIESDPEYRHPFKANCSVAFDSKVKHIACDSQFNDIQAPESSCESEQQLNDNELSLLAKSYLFQMRTLVGLGPIQHPQVRYWWYYKLPPTPSQSISPTDSPDSLTAVLSVTRSSSNSPSHSTAHSPSLSSSNEVIWNPEWANWDVATGVYRDETNQTGRYNETIPGVVTDVRTGLQWQKPTAPGTYNWTEASKYCENLVLGGCADWRLPTHVELQGLLDYTVNCSGPSIHIATFPDTPQGYFWTSEQVANGGRKAWSIGFGKNASDSFNTNYAGAICSNGVGACGSVPNQRSTRCVRPGMASQQVNHYRDENGKELSVSSTQVLDTLTGLIWQRGVSGPLRWNSTGATGSAQAYCNQLSLGSQPTGSWRLPSIKELATLLNLSPSHPGPTINSTAFPTNCVQYNGFWSSTSFTCDASRAWLFGFDYGYYMAQYPVTSGYCARCVRSSSVINPEWANWDQSLGVYEDATNQTRRYIDTRPGVVTDTLTELQWEKETEPNTYNWTAAKARCDNLFKVGFGDWRLPTRIELQSLVDYAVSSLGNNPAINSEAFPGTPIDYFWSATPLAGYPSENWYVSFGENASYTGMFCSPGYVAGCGSGIANQGHVRCVRPLAKSTVVDRYRDEAGDLLTSGSTQVQDTWTGLIWQRAVTGNHNWANAMNYCENLVLEGHRWRLPDIKELSTLLDVDTTHPGPTINETVFPNTPAAAFLSSSPVANRSQYAWFVHFQTGVNGLWGITSSAYARCVRTCNTPPSAGLLSAWPASQGVYQDATNQSGRYTVSNGIVADLLTNMQWQQEASTSNMTFTEAQNYCKAQRTGGHRDWRLPNNAELLQLIDYTIDYSQGVPGINSLFSNTPSTYFYSDTPYSSINPNQSWWMSFGNKACYTGLLGSSAVDSQCAQNGGYVRCVRSCYSKPAQDRYQISDRETTDLVTGLIWQRDAAPSLLNITQAINYCLSLFMGGKIWRLPTIKEAMSIINWPSGPSNPPINQTAFRGNNAGAIRTSTKPPQRSDVHWMASSSLGSTSFIANDRLVEVHCVRSCDTPPANGILAAWPASRGVYQDSTNQPGRYTVSNEVVSDTLTDMQWQLKASPTNMTFAEARDYCKAQSTGGYRDWRLPNSAELIQLVDYTINAYGPLAAINTVFGNTPRNFFFSQTMPLGTTEYGPWSVSFGQAAAEAPYAGLNDIRSNSSSLFVRCIRSCYPSNLINRYYVAHDEVEDLASGLIWQKSAFAQMNHSSAQQKCSDSKLNNHPWRLPTVKELASLIYTSAPYSTLLLDPLAFSGEPAYGYWSSTKLEGNSENMWAIDFRNAYTYSNPPNSNFYFVRCVRSCDTPPLTGLLAAWPASRGVYLDGTNQAGRYNVSGEIVLDTLTDMKWQLKASLNNMTFAQAQDYCKAQNTGGYRDWRLPNNAELTQLVDYTISTVQVPGINSVFNTTPTDLFYSSTPISPNSTGWWYMSFGRDACYGGVLANSASSPNCGSVLPHPGYTRCVRSCYAAPALDRYQANSNEVTDSVTGLIWQKTANTEGKNYTEAIDYCANLVTNGYSWRLPTIKELLTLVDYGTTPGSLRMNTTIFAGESSAHYISVSQLTGTSQYAWSVPFSTGAANALIKSASISNVRCVRTQTPPYVGLLAAWPASSGVYDDAVNQTGRYTVFNGVVIDTLTQIQWEQVAGTDPMPFSSVYSYCASRETGGYRDWRPPNILELGTLIDYTSSTPPFLNTTVFPGAPASDFWSGSKDIGNIGYSWRATGSTNVASLPQTNSSSLRVRCARSSYSIPSGSRYLVGTGLSTGTVTDKVTGLTWQQFSPVTGGGRGNGRYDGTAATTICESLSLDGGSWRLPTIRELTSLLDYSIPLGSLMMNTGSFTGERADWFWSSTPQKSNPASMVRFELGSIENPNAGDLVNGGYIRCVRSP